MTITVIARKQQSSVLILRFSHWNMIHRLFDELRIHFGLDRLNRVNRITLEKPRLENHKSFSVFLAYNKRTKATYEMKILPNGEVIIDDSWWFLTSCNYWWSFLCHASGMGVVEEACHLIIRAIYTNHEPETWSDKDPSKDSLGSVHLTTNCGGQ